jgi:precorrin-4 methylase
MKGDRYGTVVRITRRGPGKDNLITVKMDKSGQTVRYAASLVSKVL